MSKLPDVSGTELIKALQKAGFAVSSLLLPLIMLFRNAS
jgi:hypothetical protein